MTLAVAHSPGGTRRLEAPQELEDFGQELTDQSALAAAAAGAGDQRVAAGLPVIFEFSWFPGRALREAGLAKGVQRCTAALDPPALAESLRTRPSLEPAERPWPLRACNYSRGVNDKWMRQKLNAYLRLLTQYRGMPRAGVIGPDNPVLDGLRRKEPTVKRILEALDPKLAGFDFKDWDDEVSARHAVLRGIGVLDDREEWAASLAPRSPVAQASSLHPWVWNPALTLWDTGHYRQAVHAAATSITMHTQAKLGRRDVADDALMQEAFSPSAPRPGKPRLRCPGDPADQTVQSRQRGALQYAVGCYFAIRNPAAHEHGEWDKQAALEHLAALSLLARWIDGWTLDTAP